MISDRMRESDLNVLSQEQITLVYWLYKGLKPEEIAEQNKLGKDISPTTVWRRQSEVFDLLHIEVEKGKREFLLGVYGHLIKELTEDDLKVWKEEIAKPSQIPLTPTQEDSQETSQPSQGDSHPPITEKSPTASPDIPQRRSIDTEPDPISLRVIPAVLIVGLIAIIALILFFVFGDGGDDPQATEVSQVQPTAIVEPTIELTLEPTQAPTLVPTDTPLPTNTPAPTYTKTPTQTQNPFGLTQEDTLVGEGSSLLMRNFEFYPYVFTTTYMVGFRFTFRNTSTSNKLFQTYSRDYVLLDNTGNEYECIFLADSFHEMEKHEDYLDPQEEYKYSLLCGAGLEIIPEVSEFTLFVSNLSTIPDSSWIAPVSR